MTQVARLQRELDEARVQREQFRVLVDPMREELTRLQRENAHMRDTLHKLRSVVITHKHRKWIDQCLGR